MISLAGRDTPPALMVTAGLVVTLSGTQGLVGMLVVLAVCGVANRSGPRAGVVLAATAGLVVIAESAWHELAKGFNKCGCWRAFSLDCGSFERHWRLATNG